jgi:electron transfer flavoprotein alpha subunit
MADILVFAQIEDGAVHDVTLQALAKARELAAGGKVSALAIGAGAGNAAKTLIAHGADAVAVADDARLASYVPPAYLRVAKDFLAGRSFAAFLLPATTTGTDLAAAVAAALGLPCVLEAAKAVAAGGKPVFQRLEYDRKVLAGYAAAGEATVVASLKDGVAEPLPADAGRAGAVEALAVNLDPADLAVRVVKRDVVKKTANLKVARIIVGAGAGLGSKDNFEKIRPLAAKLGAQIGATRPVVDAGWLPADHQIGQTGATVRPDVYLALGVSGAVQHWVGMSEAKAIVAVNLDKNAPIMKRAHYRIAGDVNAVVPKLMKLLG